MAVLGIGVRRRGAATVEMALVLPLLLALTFGLIEYGWLFLKAEEMGSAARAGARAASMPGATTTAVLASIASQMTEAGMGGSGYSVTFTPANVASPLPGETIRVVIKVDYSKIALTGIPLVPVPPNLIASVSMVKEGP